MHGVRPPAWSPPRFPCSISLEVERQLAEDYRDPETGIDYPNLIDMASAVSGYPEGSNFFTSPVVNWDLDAAKLGNFVPSDPVPAIVGMNGP